MQTKGPHNGKKRNGNEKRQEKPKLKKNWPKTAKLCEFAMMSCFHFFGSVGMV